MQLGYLSKPTFISNARLILAFFLFAFFTDTGIGQQRTLSLEGGMIIGPGQDSQVVNIVEPIGSVNANAEVKTALLTVMDDGLRRTYVCTGRVKGDSQVNQTVLKIELENKPASNVAKVPFGPIINSSMFSKFGRRICLVKQSDKVISITQGITEITTNYVKVEGLARPNGSNGSYEWDMRLSLSSFSSQKMEEILLQNASKTNPNDWVAIVNLFESAKRYEEARSILGRAILRYPELESLKPELKRFDQNIADQLFSASEMAAEAGQTQYSKLILENIKKARLSIETQLKVGAKLEAIASGQKDRDELIAWITEDVSKVADERAKMEMQALIPEIATYLTADTASRFTDYRRRRSDATLKPDQLAALAFSGWIFGPTAGKDSASVVAAGIKARRLVTEYLAKPVRDDQILQDLAKLESGTPELVSKILANMPPPKPTLDTDAVMVMGEPKDSSQPPAQTKIPGRFAIDVPLGGDMLGRTSRYMVQLPPEYNPFRRYPCIFTLPSDLTNVEWQIGWWAGQYSPENNRCIGDASKRGYIVVSPNWLEPKQPSYNYTENEHAMILAPLRDALRRFSIDTDRVFLSGHFMGADAAWDIALAHPDLWAGNIVISGEAQNYVVHNWNNAIYVPSYFVAGEYDKFTETNGKEWEKLLKDRKIDSMVTLYRGRKPDHFQEELPRIMSWMSFPARVRSPIPKDSKFEATTSRAGDRFFWWFEAKQLFTDKLIHPLLYNAGPNKPGQDYRIESSINREANTISMKTVPAKYFTIWLSPEMVDFDKQLTISIKGVRDRRNPTPETRVMLEDVRGRADRQHPFWMRVDFPN